MKKKALKAALIVAVVAVAGYGVYQNRQQETMSEVMMANVEALATDESGSSTDCCDTCKGEYCGLFYPANGSGIGIKMYYK